MQRTWTTPLLVLALFATTCVAFGAVEKKTQNVTIKAQKMVYNWKSDTLEFWGKCQAEVSGPDKAVMSAEKITGKFRDGGNKVGQIIAAGPVHFDITTSPDTDGLRRHITADCKGQAIYEGVKRTMTLTGGAEAFLTTVPTTARDKPATFAGETVVIDLKTFEISVEGGVHFEIEIPAEAPEEAATTQ